MNNSFIPGEEPEKDYTPLRERDSEMLRVLESLTAVENSNEWSTLRELAFDKRLESLEKSLILESKKDEVNLPEVYRLQGRISEARRLTKLSETYKLERVNIKRQLNPPGLAGIAR